jgi:sec-independent protein translocase protein TatC
MRLIPKWMRRTPREHDGSMTLVEHLQELRFRLVISVAAITAGAILGWFLFDPVLNLIQTPYCDYWETVPRASRPTQDCTLFFFGALEGVIAKLKLVGFMGLFFALPVVLFQMWRFVVPGLTQRERRLSIPFVLCSMFLFLLGAAFAYWTLPKALEFLLGFAGTQFAPLLTADKYLSFVMLVALSFGLAFEFPIALVFLQMAGVVTSRQLRDWRRGAILAIALFAAIITPSADPYTMLAMTIPMVLFYEAAIIIGRIMKK